MRDDISIREERETDIPAIYYVNEQAFGSKAEAELVDNLRNAEELMLSMVAVRDYDADGKHQHEIVGHVGYSPATVESDGTTFIALCLAPVAVLPAYQRQGIGSQLIKASLKKCLRVGHQIVFLVGHPEYYPRFGFVPAHAKGFECEYPAPNAAWMMLELRKGAADGHSGLVKFHPAFREAAGESNLG